MNGRLYTIVVAILVTVLLSLAIGLGLFRTPGVPSTEFLAHRAMWRAAGIANYQVTMEAICYCEARYDRPVRITVRGGTVASPRPAGRSGRSAADGGRVWPLDIDQLFARIEEAYVDSYEGISVRYDPALGFPVRAALDPSLATVDDEVTYVLSDFESQGPG